MYVGIVIVLHHTKYGILGVVSRTKIIIIRLYKEGIFTMVTFSLKKN